MIHRPKLLILDEPFSGFDPVNANLLKREILELRNEGATIIFSTHNMASVEELCDRVSLIHHSEVVLQGDVDDIREQHKKHLFNVATREGALQPNLNMYEIIDNKPCRNGTVSTLRKIRPEITNGKLIQELSRQYELTAFEEILPTMNEIFIETVGESAIVEDKKQTLKS